MPAGPPLLDECGAHDPNPILFPKTPIDEMWLFGAVYKTHKRTGEDKRDWGRRTDSAIGLPNPDMIWPILHNFLSEYWIIE